MPKNADSCAELKSLEDSLVTEHIRVKKARKRWYRRYGAGGRTDHTQALPAALLSEKPDCS